MLRRLSAISIALLAIVISNLHSATIIVPDDAATIQGGIDIASDGDTVMVTKGYYTGPGNRDIDFFGKAIVVMSEDGPWVTVIDCEGDSLEPHRGFYLHSGEGSASVIRGFTIRGGYTTIEWTGGNGGAIFCDGSSPTIEGNFILRNAAEFNGGGICSQRGSYPAIIDNLIAGNVTLNDGGGIWCDNSSTLISGNFITGNKSTFGGGGIHIDYGSPIIENTVVSHNSALWGGGLYCFDASPVLKSCTISMNNSLSIGGGLYCIYSASPEIDNSILWGDTPDEIFYDFGEPAVTYSNLEGGWPGEGNIDDDPLFVLPERRDFRLLWGSPCIDTGDPMLVDPDGTRGDIGAFPFDQLDYMTVYITPDTAWVTGGQQVGVTFTYINRWPQPETYWMLTQGILPNGMLKRIRGPEQDTIPPEFIEQDYIIHTVPVLIPPAKYDYWTRIGIRPPPSLYDEDRFSFAVE